MKTCKIAKNVIVTLAQCHDNIHIGQTFDGYYTSINKPITVTAINEQTNTDIYDRQYKVNCIVHN